MRPALLLSLMLVVLALPGSAATFAVDTTADAPDATPGDGLCAAQDGHCTLRAAIEETNALAGADTITLPAGTYTPASPDTLFILDSLEIAGAGRDQSLITGFELCVSAPRSSKLVRIEDLAILASPAPFFADGFGTLEFTRVRIANGLSSGFSRAFGMRVEFHESPIENNAGSGILSDDGSPVVVSHSIIRGNGAWGIFSNDMPLIVTSSLIEANALGGIRHNQDPALITGSIIEDNLGPGIHQVTHHTGLVDSIVRRNRGGGVRANQATIVRSAIYDNDLSSGCGGGVFVDETGHLVASTVAGNTAPEGGGVCMGSSRNGGRGIRILSTTITENEAATGGGIALDSEAIALAMALGYLSEDITIQESIVAGNSAPASPDCFAPFIPESFPVPSLRPSAMSQGHNLIGDGTGCELTATTGDAIGTTGSPVDPRLLPLADRGGPTPTHAIAPSSPARDAIPSLECDTSVFDVGDPPARSLFIDHDSDQRGVPRPQGSGCDIGAFEIEPGRDRRWGPPPWQPHSAHGPPPLSRLRTR